MDKKLNDEQEERVDVIEWANTFDTPSEYYKNEFNVIRRQRPSDAAFLYTLKLSYERGLERTGKSIEKLQRGFFADIDFPYDPLKSLCTWVEVLAINEYYFLPDVARDVGYPKDRKRQIMDYLGSRFPMQFQITKIQFTYWVNFLVKIFSQYSLVLIIHFYRTKFMII